MHPTRRLALALSPALVVAGCGLFQAAAPPTTTLAVCVAHDAEQHPGLPLLEYVAIAIEDCGGDALAVLDAILTATKGAATAYQPAVRELQDAGGERLQGFVREAHARVAARRMAITASHADAGSAR